MKRKFKKVGRFVESFLPTIVGYIAFLAFSALCIYAIIAGWKCSWYLFVLGTFCLSLLSLFFIEITREFKMALYRYRHFK